MKNILIYNFTVEESFELLTSLSHIQLHLNRLITEPNIADAYREKVLEDIASYTRLQNKIENAIENVI